MDIALETMSWSLKRYHEAIRAGILTKHDRVELIHGQLVSKIPIGEDHSGCIELLQDYFRELFGRQYRYRSENPVPILPNSEPEPDFLIADKLAPGNKLRHPTLKETRLIIEVAYSTLSYDRKVKAPLYASSGIPEYWIINLKDRKIEVYHGPSVMDGTWKRVTSFDAEESFDSPFAGAIRVYELLLPEEG